MSENKDTPNFSPGPTPEQIDKFRITDQTKVPDIRMQADPSQSQQSTDRLNEADKRDRPIRGFETQFSKMTESFIELMGGKDNKEKREHEYDVLMDMQMTELLRTADTCLRKVSVYPYENRQQRYFFEQGEDVTTEVLREVNPKVATPEARSEVESFASDIAWGKGTFSIMEALSVGIKYYFSGPDMLQNWMAEYKVSPTAGDFKESFSAEHKGSVGRLRQVATKFQDDVMYWSIAVAANGQIDATNEVKSSSPLMNLTDIEKNFIDKLFKRKRVFDGKTSVYNLNWFANCKTAEDKKDYLNTMQALMLSNARERLNKIGAVDQEKLLDEIAGDVLAYKNVISLENGESMGVSGPQMLKLSEFIAKYMIILHQGTMSSTELAWGWEYKEEVDDEGKVKLIRTNKTGGVYGSINNATDAYTPKDWAWHDIMYDDGFRKRTNLMLATSQSGRDDWLSRGTPKDKPPYTYEEEIKRDPYLKKAFEYLWGNSEKAKNWRADFAKDFWHKNEKDDALRLTDNQIRLLKNMLWFWETPFEAPLDNEPGAGVEKNHNMRLPVFIPPSISTVNFFNSTIPGEEEGAGETVWSRLQDKENLSQVEWNKINDDQFDKWLVNMNMMSRWLNLLVDPVNVKEDRGQPEMKFFGDPSGIKEIVKRDFLGNRNYYIEYVNEDGKKVKVSKPDLEIMTVPFMAALALANNHGIFEAGTIGIFNKDKWNEDVANWAKHFAYAPVGAGGSENYRQAMTLMFIFYTSVLKRMDDEYSRAEMVRTQVVKSTLGGFAKG